MNLFETLLQDLRYGARTLRRNPSFTIVSILALALGIGVNVAVFTAYKAFVARPLDGRDPDTLVNLSRRLQSGATQRDIQLSGLRGLPGRSAIVQRRHRVLDRKELTLSDAGGAVASWTRENGSLIGRLGLLPPSASNREIASAFVVSENYFSVLGVRTRAWPRVRCHECV